MRAMKAVTESAKDGASYWLEGDGQRKIGYWTGDAWALGFKGMAIIPLGFEPGLYGEAVSG